jgi:hypothetical protein
MHVWVTNRLELILIRTIAEYVSRDICLSSLSLKRPNAQIDSEAHRLVPIRDRNRTLAKRKRFEQTMLAAYGLMFVAHTFVFVV